MTLELALATIGLTVVTLAMVQGIISVLLWALDRYDEWRGR